MYGATSKWSDIEFYTNSVAVCQNKYNRCVRKKINKTLRETIEHGRYAKFANITKKQYTDHLDELLGTFLAHLKETGDPFYKHFLNAYGDGSYCTFSLSDKTVTTLKGIYAYSVGEELMYIGRCRDNFGKRINTGYGRICAKNCYIDGQATNCHLNQLINLNVENTRLFYHSLTDDLEIAKIEKALIKTYYPKWNIALKEK